MSSLHIFWLEGFFFVLIFKQVNYLSIKRTYKNLISLEFTLFCGGTNSSLIITSSYKCKYLVNLGANWMQTIQNGNCHATFMFRKVPTFKHESYLTG